VEYFKPLKAASGGRGVSRGKYHFQLPVLHLFVFKLALRPAIQHDVKEVGLQHVVNSGRSFLFFWIQQVAGALFVVVCIHP
jgi:hypothetical protein